MLIERPPPLKMDLSWEEESQLPFLSPTSLDLLSNAFGFQDEAPVKEKEEGLHATSEMKPCLTMVGKHSFPI